MASRKRKKNVGTEAVRTFLRDAAAPTMHAAVSAHARGESVFGAWMSALQTQAHAAVARSAYDWVTAQRGRRVVLEWVGDHVQMRRYEPNGKESHS